MTELPGAIRLPDGSWVRGRGLRQPAPTGTSPDHGLYLGSRRMRRQHDAALTWPHDWIDWPDFLLPRDREDAVTRIRAVHERARASHGVEVACVGGVGRTGTVIACLAVLAGVAPELRQRAATDGVHSTALAIDPRNWELVQFTLWEDTARESAGTRYRVLHLSTPELGELHAGRHW